jgi:hypothetical protein
MKRTRSRSTARAEERFDEERNRTLTGEIRSFDSPPPRLDEVRAIAAALPGTTERPHLSDAPSFRVGRKTYALYWRPERSWVFKLPNELRDELFGARPETFVPMRSGKLLWSYVVIEHLSGEELRSLLVAAWRTVAPRKVSRGAGF